MDVGVIDVSFDFRTDTPPGKDPDTFSVTLGRYHQLLWSKPLPSGEMFHLTASDPPVHLHHRSELGEFWLTSDTVIHTYRSWIALRGITDQLPDTQHEEFLRLAYSIGGMMVWPGNRIDGKMTINGARGFIRRISDRFDLTVECVRRRYLDEWSPLQATFARYHAFFELFGDFRGFVDFFLLQDIVSPDYSAVRFFMPFDDFDPPAVPYDLTSYLTYRTKAVAFIEARNRRIASMHGTTQNSPVTGT